MDSSKIEWLRDDEGRPGTTWNPHYGCKAVSAGCTNCYATRQVVRFQGHQGARLVRSGPKGPLWTGQVSLARNRLRQPLRMRKPSIFFVTSLSDPFYEEVPTSYVDEMHAVMALCQRHTFILLTKRPEEAHCYYDLRTTEEQVRFQAELIHQDETGEHLATWDGWPLPNLWLGTSAEDQATAEERVPWLLRTSAARRVLSAEPLLGPMSLRPQWLEPGGGALDWVIVGGESGPNARPFNLLWAESLIAQCRSMEVCCFVKQLGSKPVYSAAVGARHELPAAFLIKDKKGGNIEEWPENLRVRERPHA